MDNQKVIELRQRIVSLDMSNSNLHHELQNQQQNVRMGWAAVFVSSACVFAAGVGLLMLPFAINFLVKSTRKRDSLEKECSDSGQQLIVVKNELILAEQSNS